MYICIYAYMCISIYVYMHRCISANMHLCINVDMHICIYAYMYTHKHHLAHIISFCMGSPTHVDNTISMHMHKQIHTNI